MIWNKKNTIKFVIIDEIQNIQINIKKTSRSQLFDLLFISWGIVLLRHTYDILTAIEFLAIYVLGSYILT